MSDHWNGSSWREVFVVAKRESTTYFASAIAYVFGGLFLGVLMYFTVDQIDAGRRADMTLFFLVLPWVLLGFVPALTMRLWAEERKLGTIELLLTFPVRRTSLVLGKWIAAVGFVAVLFLLTLGLPSTLGAYGEIDWGPVFAAYLGSVALTAAYVAAGLFFSSLTGDQILAFLGTSVGLLGLAISGSDSVLMALRDAGLPQTVVEAMGAISPITYFRSIARGVLDTRDLVFFIAFCALFLQLTALVLDRRRSRG